MYKKLAYEKLTIQIEQYRLINQYFHGLHSIAADNEYDMYKKRYIKNQWNNLIQNEVWYNFNVMSIINWSYKIWRWHFKWNQNRIVVAKWTIFWLIDVELWDIARREASAEMDFRKDLMYSFPDCCWRSMRRHRMTWLSRSRRWKYSTSLLSMVSGLMCRILALLLSKASKVFCDSGTRRVYQYL